MSEANQSNDQQAAGSDTPSSDAMEPSDARRKRGNWRFKILLFLFGLTLFALWYDYRVARVKVETAYEKILALNTTSVNAGVGNAAMTNLDVQETLGCLPSETYPEGLYTVEVYRWTAGLPFKTHNYYAVYLKGRTGNKLFFNTHFKFGFLRTING